MQDREGTLIFERLFEQLKYDEGVVYEIYKDHLGYPTFGIGHLVLKSDPNSLIALPSKFMLNPFLRLNFKDILL